MRQTCSTQPEKKGNRSEQYDWSLLSDKKHDTQRPRGKPNPRCFTVTKTKRTVPSRAESLIARRRIPHSNGIRQNGGEKRILPNFSPYVIYRKTARRISLKRSVEPKTLADPTQLSTVVTIVLGIGDQETGIRGRGSGTYCRLKLALIPGP